MTVAVNKMTLRSDSAIVDAAIISSPTTDNQTTLTGDCHVTVVTNDAPQDGPTLDSAASSAIVDDNARLLHTLDSAGGVLLNKSS